MALLDGFAALAMTQAWFSMPCRTGPRAARPASISAKRDSGPNPFDQRDSGLLKHVSDFVIASEAKQSSALSGASCGLGTKNASQAMLSWRFWMASLRSP
ncbi:MAG: hypothetical protein HEQ16_14435 [Bosea sp.]|nr:hypothetical protein [Bosea sp. (in: a-proteobacteria)]